MTRKLFLLFYVLLFLVIATSCAKEEEKIINIDTTKINMITVKTQMTENIPDEVTITTEGKIEEIVKAINNISYKPIEGEEHNNGWQYWFSINYNDEANLEEHTTNIMFIDNEANIDGKYYKVSNYEKEQFLYLFK